MYVKLFPKNLNLDPCLPHPINIYTYGVITAPKVHGGIVKNLECLSSVLSIKYYPNRLSGSPKSGLLFLI